MVKASKSRQAKVRKNASSSETALWLVEANFQQAQAAHQHGEWARARSLYEWVLGVAPDHVQSLHYLGVMAIQQEDFHAAVRWINRAIAIQSPDPNMLTHLAVAQLRLNAYEAAIASCDRALALDPNCVGAYYNRADALQANCQYQEAVRSYDAALALAPEVIGLYVNRGNALQELHELEAAEASYTCALSLNSMSFDAYLNRGNVRVELGRWDEALADYDQASRLQPWIKQVHINRIKVLMLQKKWDQALTSLTQVHTPVAYAESLKCLYELGRHDEFFACVTAQRDQDKNNVRAASIVAFVAHQTQRVNEHAFCPNPLDFLSVGHVSSHEKHADQFIESVIEILLARKAAWNPLRKATQSGFQTPSSLFVQPEGVLARLQEIILSEIRAYHRRFQADSCYLIQGWPKKLQLEGWFVRLTKSGYQRKHIHPEGWLSGVLYLQVVPSLGQQEGGIEFGLHGDDLTVLDNNYPRHVHLPQRGDIVLFPSSLFHRTIPFSTDGDRMIVAFDLMPR